MDKKYSLSLSKETDEARYKEFMGFLGLAYKDYIAARTLLRTDQLFRGVIIANTCIEKYFKVFLAVKGNKSKTHNVSKLLNSVQNFDPNLAKSINSEFIDFLSKAYNMRYFDNDVFNDSKIEFNICICRNKTLAELDYIVNIIENSWNLIKGNQKIKRTYEIDVESNSELLIKDNYIFMGISKTDFIENQSESILELRNTKKMGLIEVAYKTVRGRDDGIFSNEALKQANP